MNNEKLIQACRSHISLARELSKKISGATGPRQFVTFSLFFRALCAFEAAVILTEQGMLLEAGNCARTVLEAQFIFRKCKTNPEWANSFIKSALKSQESLVNALLGLGRKILKQLKDFKGLKERLKEIQADPLFPDATDLNLQNIAHEIGQPTDYVLKYRSLSILCTHVTPDCLAQFWDVDDRGNPIAIRDSPDPRFKSEALMLAGKAFEEITKDFIEIHELKVDDFTQTWDEISGLIKQHKADSKME